MYYEEVARPPTSHHLAVTFVALALLGCKRDIYPLKFVPTPGADSSITPDSSVPIGDCPPAAVMGYATMSDLGGEWDGGTDGGPTLELTGGVQPDAMGTVVVVDAQQAGALDQFSMYAKMAVPLTIVIKGMIDIPLPPDGGSGDLQKIRVSSNKSIIGANLQGMNGSSSGSGFTGGGIWLTGVKNIVLQNLVIAMPNSDDSSDNVDAIHIEGSTQIWVDHCDLSSNGPGADAGAAYDGLVDISDASDFVTVSWTRYHDHPATGLVGRSDTAAAAAEDAFKNHVTWDHDLFSDVGTGPRVRFGRAHVLNSYFYGVNDYAVASLDGAFVKIEGCYFQNVAPVQNNADYGPVTTIVPGATAGNVDLVDPIYASSGANVLTTPNVPFAMEYQNQYVPDSARSVPALVNTCAGTGRIAAPTGN
jgi:pectate lyase